MYSSCRGCQGPFYRQTIPPERSFQGGNTYRVSVSVVPATVVVTVEALLVSLSGLFCEAVFDQSSIPVARRALQDRVQNQQSGYLLAPVTSMVLVEVNVMAGGVSVSVAAVFCPVTVVEVTEVSVWV